MIELAFLDDSESHTMDAISDEIVNETHCVGRSTKFIWKIKNFSACPVNFGESIRSENFMFQKGTFYLEAYYSDVNMQGSWMNYFTLKVNCATPSPEKLVCMISAMDANKGIIGERECFQIAPNSESSDGINLILKSALKVCLPGDCITVVSELMSICIKQDLKTQSTVSCSRHESLSRDLGQLLTTEANCDMDLIVDGESLRAHSLILSARSPILAAMLQHDTEKHRNLAIYIDDFKASTIKYLLLYLYTGELSEIRNLSSDTLVELYTAADKYGVTELKDMCSQAVIANLSEENIKNYATLASQHDDQKIVDLIVLFFAQNKKKISGNLWEELLVIIPTLADQVLSEIVNEIE